MACPPPYNCLTRDGSVRDEPLTATHTHGRRGGAGAASLMCGRCGGRGGDGGGEVRW